MVLKFMTDTLQVTWCMLLNGCLLRIEQYEFMHTLFAQRALSNLTGYDSIVHSHNGQGTKACNAHLCSVTMIMVLVCIGAYKVLGRRV